jgi:predicted PurR-regulated permease PerM
VVLTTWAIVVIHSVDNVVRPFLVGQQAKLRPIYLFFAILGGLKAFGIVGLLIGPVVLSIGVVLFGILKDQIKDRQPIRRTEPGAPQDECAPRPLSQRILGVP